MKALSLSPYPGEIFYCETRKELRKKYKELCGVKYPYSDPTSGGGKYVYVEGRKGEIWFLVYGKSAPIMAHEFVHCLLKLFELVGIDPGASSGEPLCYMLTRLMKETLNENE